MLPIIEKEDKTEFKILSARDHVRLRTGMYLGSVSLEEKTKFILGKYKNIKFVPALIKCIDEIIDNCIDEAIRTNFKYANKINVNLDLDDNKITVEDNGRGIPQVKVKDENGEEQYQAVAAWTKTMAGTSFSETRETIGANGLGSAAVNFMSKSFVGETWQNKNLIQVISKNGAEITQVKQKKLNNDTSGTKVTFIPDMLLFGIDDISQSNVLDIIQDRLTALSIAFPKIQFKFQNKVIKESNARAYSKLFVSEYNEKPIVEDKTNFKLIITSSGKDDGYKTNSYVNGVNTYLGGSYIDFVSNEIVDELIILIKKKYKIDITKATIKNGLKIILFVAGFENPQFDSQTKERLTSSATVVKKHFSNIDIDLKKIANKIISNNEIIEPIIESQLAKKIAQEKREATLKQKKLKKAKVAKHIAASKPERGMIFITEGLSSLSFLLKVRNPQTVGAYPLKGVVMNTWDLKPTQVLKNKELSELIAILNLDINNPNSVDNMTYDKIAGLTDRDYDGSGIMGLLMAFFYKHWPRLFTEGRIFRAMTPIVISTNGKDTKWFYDLKEGVEFKNNEGKSWSHRYIKGLAGHTEAEYSKIINEPYLLRINVDNPELFDMIYGDDVMARKEWLSESKKQEV